MDRLIRLSFVNAFAVYIFTVFMAVYFFAILLPNKVSSPIITQFTTMVGTLLPFMLGYFYGDSKARQRSANQNADPGTHASMSATITTNPDPPKTP